MTWMFSRIFERDINTEINFNKTIAELLLTISNNIRIMITILYLGGKIKISTRQQMRCFTVLHIF